MSTITFRARFDGRVLVPSEDVPLVKDLEYVLVTSENGAPREETVLAELARLATDIGPPDLSERWEEYARRGTPDA